jgi:hypothetical protein
VNYTVTVTNSDSVGCNGSVFSFQSTQPGWVATFSPAMLTLSPGQSGSVTMTLSVPAGTTVGTAVATYLVNARIFDATHNVTATASVTVTTPPCNTAQPAVSMSPANPSAYAGSSVNYTVTVTNNDSVGCNGSVFSFQSRSRGG